MDSGSSLNFQKLKSAAIKKVWHYVSASRDVGNATEQLYLRQNKLNIKVDCAEVNAGPSTK